MKKQMDGFQKNIIKLIKVWAISFDRVKRNRWIDKTQKVKELARITTQMDTAMMISFAYEDFKSKKRR